MKFIVDSLALNKALKQVSPAIQQNPVLPILETVLFKIDKTSCELTATNLALTITHKLPCESKEVFSMILPYQELLNITSVIAGQPITIEEKGNNVLIGSHHKVGKNADATNFPTIENFEPTFEMDADEDFLYHLQLATNCTSKDSTKVQFQDVCLEFKDDFVKILATDAMQLFCYQKNFKKGGWQMLIDTNFIRSLRSISQGKLSGNNKFLRVENGTTVITGTLSENKFPDCSQFFKPYEYNCTIVRSDLLSAINELMVFRAPLYKCVFTFGKDTINIKFDDNDFAHHFETDISAKHSVEIESIALNGFFLKNLLNIIPESDEVKLSIRGEKTQVHFDPENKDLKLIIMPIFNT